MATGASPLAGGNGVEGGAPPADDPEIPGIGIEGEGSGEGDEAVPEVEGAEGEGEGEAEGAEQAATGDGRTLPKWIKALQATSPEEYKRAKASFFEHSSYKQVYPTVQAARDDRALVQSLGGKDGVATLRGDAQVFKTAANQFLTGNPAFVKDLAEEDPTAFGLMVPLALQQYQQTDSEGYKITIASLWDREFKAVGFVENGLNPLKAAIAAGNKEQATAILDSILNWHNDIQGLASKSEDPRVKALLAEKMKSRETAEKNENKAFLASYSNEAHKAVKTESTKVFDSFFKGQKLDSSDKEYLLWEAMKIADKAVQADSDFAKQRDAHLANGDSSSALQLTRSRYAREMSGAVQKVARLFGRSNSPAPKQQQQQNKGQARTEPGWVKASARPDPEDLDRSRTSNDMILSGRAILKDGRKVDWSHLKQG